MKLKKKVVFCFPKLELFILIVFVHTNVYLLNFANVLQCPTVSFGLVSLSKRKASNDGHMVYLGQWFSNVGAMAPWLATEGYSGGYSMISAIVPLVERRINDTTRLDICETNPCPHD